MSEPMAEFRAVSKSFAVGDSRVPVLRDADLSVARGESVAITGPSGSGKSTVLNLLGTLDLPDTGVVRIGGVDVTTLPPEALARLRNERIGFVFQSHHLLPHCTVLENVLVPALAFRDRVPDATVAHARALLDRVGLGHRLDHQPGRLSGGERQRAAVVRALVNRPALLLADEPTGALDRASAAEVGRLLADLNREQGTTLVVVTQSGELAALMGRTLTMRDGALHFP